MLIRGDMKIKVQRKGLTRQIRKIRIAMSTMKMNIFISFPA